MYNIGTCFITDIIPLYHTINKYITENLQQRVVFCHINVREDAVCLDFGKKSWPFFDQYKRKKLIVLILTHTCSLFHIGLFTLLTFNFWCNVRGSTDDGIYPPAIISLSVFYKRCNQNGSHQWSLSFHRMNTVVGNSKSVEKLIHHRYCVLNF